MLLVVVYYYDVVCGGVVDGVGGGFLLCGRWRGCRLRVEVVCW